MDTLELLASRLRRCGFTAEVFPTGKAAALKVCELIKGHTVGVGNSMTLTQLGLLKEMPSYATKVFLRQAPGTAGADEYQALTADFYLSSVNAISMTGHLVNIDGTGNRVAATCFGPRQVIYLVGKNKITTTLEKALQRAKDTAVKLARHYQRKTPCVTTGKCEDCLSAECICAITTIHRKKPSGLEVALFLIDENLGL